MRHRTEAKEKKEKLPYEKPQIVDIELLSEEVLAVGCKTPTGGGASGFPISCVNQGCSGSLGS